MPGTGERKAMIRCGATRKGRWAAAGALLALGLCLPALRAPAQTASPRSAAPAAAARPPAEKQDKLQAELKAQLAELEAKLQALDREREQAGKLNQADP